MCRKESQLVEDIAEDVLRKLSCLKHSDTDNQIRAIEQFAKVKAQKLSHKSEPSDFEELAEAFNYHIKLNTERLENLLLRRFT